MSDNLDMTPQLTLTPEADTAAAAAPAAPTGRIKERDNTPASAREESRFFMGSAPF